MSDPTEKDNGEGAAERALRDGLRADRLSPEAMQRIRSATEAEWRAQTRTPQSRRGRWAVAAAAALVLACGAGFLAMRPAGDDAVFGQLARVGAAGVAEQRQIGSDVLLPAGSNLYANQSLEVRGDALIALEAGGNLRAARGSVVEIVAADRVELERGELYVDIPPISLRSGSFVVITPEGEFRHVGTQFAVAIVNGGTRVRVREGSVKWAGSGGESVVSAGNEAVIDRNQKITQTPLATSGREWAWVESLAPEIEIEGRPVIEFLRWFARESGRKLVIDDRTVRDQTTEIHMHGSIRGLSALEALSAVMSATSLQYELPDGAIRVSSARVAAPSTN
jgi:ferric-dicitrate binding protein FerR (iron transport regulator)